MNRLEGEVAIVTGAGQTPGDTIGNGRATAIVFAREGARVLLVDRRLDSAVQTEKLVASDGWSSFAANVSKEDDCRALVEACMGPFPATGEEMPVEFCEIVRFDDDGRVASEEIYYDQMTIPQSARPRAAAGLTGVLGSARPA